MNIGGNKNSHAYVAVAQAESTRFVNLAAAVAGPCSVYIAQSGTESLNCTDRDNLCDLRYINTGARGVMYGIFHTKCLSQTNTDLIFRS